MTNQTERYVLEPSILEAIPNPQDLIEGQIDKVISAIDKLAQVERAALSLFSLLISGEQTRTVLTKVDLMAQIQALGIEENAANQIFDFLLESDLLANSSDNLYRLSSSVLTSYLHERVSAEEVIKRSLLRDTKTQRIKYQEGIGGLMSSQEVDYTLRILRLDSFSVEEQTYIKQSIALHRRRAYVRNLVGVALIAFACIAGVMAWRASVAKKNAQENEKEAKRQAGIANEQTQKAKQLTKDLEAQNDELTKKTEELKSKSDEIAVLLAKTTLLKEQAEKKGAEAVKERAEAVKQRNRAVANERVAKDNEKQAKDNEKRAKESEEIAKRNAIEAEENKAKANKYKNIALATATALKVQQIERNKTKDRAVLALFAYYLNKENEGNNENADIHQALFAAVESHKKNNPLKNAHKSFVSSLVPSKVNENTFYSSGYDKKIRYWLVTDWQDISSIKAVGKEMIAGFGSPIQEISVNEELLIVLTQDNELHFFKGTRNNQFGNFITPRASFVKNPIEGNILTAKCIGTGESIVLANDLGEVAVYNYAQNTKKVIYKNQQKVSSVWTSKNGETILWATSQEVYQYSVATEKIIKIYEATPQTKITAIAGADNAPYYVAIGALNKSSNTATVFLSKMNTIHEKRDTSSDAVFYFQAQISDLVFNATSTYLAATSFDGYIKAFNLSEWVIPNDKLQTNNSYQPISFHKKQWATCVAFAGKEEDFLMVGFKDGEVDFFPMEQTKMVDYLENLYLKDDAPSDNQYNDGIFDLYIGTAQFSVNDYIELMTKRKLLRK